MQVERQKTQKTGSEHQGSQIDKPAPLMASNGAKDQRREEDAAAHQTIQPIHEIDGIGAAQNPEERQQRPQSPECYRAEPWNRQALQFQPAADRDHRGHGLGRQFHGKADIARIIP